MVSGSKNSRFECRLSVARETVERTFRWTGLRPKLSVAIRPGSDCNGLVTGHWPGDFAERQLFDLMAGSNQHIAEVADPAGNLSRSHNSGWAEGMYATDIPSLAVIACSSWSPTAVSQHLSVADGCSPHRFR